MGAPLPQFGFPRLRAMFRDDTPAPATTPFPGSWDRFGQVPPETATLGESSFSKKVRLQRIVAEDTVVRYSPRSGRSDAKLAGNRVVPSQWLGYWGASVEHLGRRIVTFRLSARHLAGNLQVVHVYVPTESVSRIQFHCPAQFCLAAAKVRVEERLYDRERCVCLSHRFINLQCPVRCFAGLHDDLDGRFEIEQTGVRICIRLRPRLEVLKQTEFFSDPPNAGDRLRLLPCSQGVPNTYWELPP